MSREDRKNLLYALGLGTAVTLAGAHTYRAFIPKSVEPRSSEPVLIFDNGYSDTYIDSGEPPAFAQKAISYKSADHTFSADSDEVLLARLIFGEARNCTANERAAIGYTVVNRMNDGKKYNGEGSVRDVALKANRDKKTKKLVHLYSCFADSDPNKEKMIDPERYDPESFYECLNVAQGVLNGSISDPTQGATLYYNPRVCTPKWDFNKIERVNVANSKHVFYRER